MTGRERNDIAPLLKRQIPNEVLLSEVERMLAAGRDVVLVPKGRSMLPFIRGEVDKVLLQRVPQSQLKVGNIVLAHVGERYVMHRIIDLKGDQVTLMGDGNLRGTELTMRSEIAGVVMEIITPDGRHRKPTSGWLWRRLLPIRKYLLKIYRKWNKLRTSSRVPRPEVPRQ
jgi:signal peptidase I